MWGMGGALTGPLFDGGWAQCAAKRIRDLEIPEDEEDFRRIILYAENCDAYLPVIVQPPK